MINKKPSQKLNTRALQKLIKNLEFDEMCKAICGEPIGCGTTRAVYVLKQNPNYVVKLERNTDKANFCNVTEWRYYIDNKDWKFLGKWLAPCELISRDGRMMIQRRVEHRRRKDYPKYIPAMFTDLKLTNFGWIGDDFVACDYAFLRFHYPKLMYAKWWGTLKYVKKWSA